MSTLSIIVAIADDNAIGKNNDLLWRMPADMKHFKALTTGHTVIMGRKTFESLPNGSLPNRKNVVLTSMPKAQFTNCFVSKSIHDALDICKDDDQIFIIGGAQVYKHSLDIANKMYITRVHTNFPDADTHFPNVNWDLWEETERQDFEADEKNPYPYTFLTYIRKK